MLDRLKLFKFGTKCQNQIWYLAGIGAACAKMISTKCICMVVAMSQITKREIRHLVATKFNNPRNLFVRTAH